MSRTARRTPDAPRLVTWDAGARLWRVSRDPTGLTPSTGPWSSRFSPLPDPAGAVIPSWYGATTAKGAIFESVFHAVRTTDHAPRVTSAEHAGRILAPVRTSRSLTLVDLTTTGLHAIGMSRSRLIESRPDSYPWTRAVASRLRDAAPQADGLMWVSRADDTSRSVVLYPRPDDPALEVDDTREPLVLSVGTGLDLLRELATDARITLLIP
jgi:hypothetical protein